MQDHAFEEPDEERERETADALAEHETFFHHRGDDRACEELRSHLELFALGASLPSLRLKGRGTQTPVDFSGTATGHMPLLSQPLALPSSAGGAGGLTEEEAA